MKVLLTGSKGQLGQAIKIIAPKLIGTESLELITTSRENLDLLNPKECYYFIKNIKPNWVINAAAYTNVDGAENKKKEVIIVNRDSPNAMAEALLETGGRLLQISTDFVFDGKSSSPYLTNHPTNPLNYYGKSKEEGEKLLISKLSSSQQINVIRTSWLMGPKGNNFATKMLQLHNERAEINVIFDQIGCPTTTYSLANFCWDLIQKSIDSKSIPDILHWCDAGVASWYDVAIAIGEIGYKLGRNKSIANVKPIFTAQYSQIAKRPNFSLLNCQLSEKIFRTKRLHWRKSLEEMFNLKLDFK